MSRPWMPLYIADYLADTRWLNTAQHGAYLLLIMEYWRSGGLPDDDEILARIVLMTPSEWKKSRPILQRFFHNGWKHKRLDVELEKAASISNKRASSARMSHSKRNANASANADANADANAEQVHTQSQSQSQSQRKGLIEDGGGVNVKGEKPPRHGAISRDKKFIYFEKGTPEFEAYAADYREAKGCDPDVNASGGRWFDMLGQFLQKGTC